MDSKILIRRIFLIVVDICIVVLASAFSLLMRFDFNFKMIPGNYLDNMWDRVFYVAIITIVLFYALRLYHSLWEYAGATEMVYILLACFFSSVINLLVYNYTINLPSGGYVMPRSFYIQYAGLLYLGVSLSRYMYRAIRRIKAGTLFVRKGKKRVMIIGAGAAGSMLVREILSSSQIDKHIVGAIDDDPSKQGTYIHGVKVIGKREDIVKKAKELEVEEIIIALPTASATEVKEIIEICKSTGCKLKRVPGMYQLVNGEVSVNKLKEVDVVDLLGREPVKVDLESIMGYVSNRVILITGAGGSIGSELCRQIASHKPKQMILIDIYENNAYDIQQELKRKYPDLDLRVLIASVRNTKRIDDIFEEYKPDIVYHAAAHKHVPLMEDSPNEAVKNNVLGTYKVVDASHRFGVKKFVMISTDKAVNPTNIMGATKRLCEMIVQSYNTRSNTEFVAVRFGNVLGSNGSVIPLFKKQIAEGGPVTVTHPDIIRYFMTIPEAVSLVLQAGAYAKGGEIFVLDMGEPVKILDLAKNLILLSGHKPGEDIKIEFTGLRPGEKLYEEMLMAEEGLQDTENALIHIGKPIDFDVNEFMVKLKELSDYVVNEPLDIKQKVAEMLPNYKISE